jgi:hypothetical protein
VERNLLWKVILYYAKHWCNRCKTPTKAGYLVRDFDAQLNGLEGAFNGFTFMMKLLALLVFSKKSNFAL